MKKTRLLLVLLLFAFLMAGCSSQETPAAASQPSEPPVQTVDTPSPTPEPVPETPAEEPEPQPIYAAQLADGSYEITVDSSASMFRVISCVLQVENGAMSATMTMSGQGYGMVYMGTGEEALQDTEDSYIPFELDAAGAKTFTVPVEALNEETDCAAWSIRKEKWYDRVLIFESDSIPTEAIKKE